MKEVWIPGLSIDFDDFISISVCSLVFCFDWEDISNTRNSASLAIQTPRISSKILCYALYFQFSTRCLDIPMKHCLSCLIYYLQARGKAIKISNTQLIASGIDIYKKSNHISYSLNSNNVKYKQQDGQSHAFVHILLIIASFLPTMLCVLI